MLESVVSCYWEYVNWKRHPVQLWNGRSIAAFTASGRMNLLQADKQKVNRVRRKVRVGKSFLSSFIVLYSRMEVVATSAWDWHFISKLLQRLAKKLRKWRRRWQFSRTSCRMMFLRLICIGPLGPGQGHKHWSQSFRRTETKLHENANLERTNSTSGADK